MEMRTLGGNSKTSLVVTGKASGGGIRIGEIDLVSVVIKVTASLFAGGNTYKLREHLVAAQAA
jgi:hypothetical protein